MTVAYAAITPLFKFKKTCSTALKLWAIPLSWGDRRRLELGVLCVLFRRVKIPPKPLVFQSKFYTAFHSYNRPSPPTKAFCCIPRGDPITFQLKQMGCASSKESHQNDTPALGRPVYNPPVASPPNGIPIGAPAANYPATATAPGMSHIGMPAQVPANAGKCFKAGYHDIHVLVDDSSSMRPTWTEAKEGVEALLSEAVKYDEDGVNVSFLNHEDFYNVKTIDEVIRVFTSVGPVGTTPTAEAIRRITSEYWADFDPKAPKKPLSVVVVTDGCPNDPRAVEAAIVDSAQRMQRMGLPKGQLGFTFVGIGIYPGSTAYNHLVALDRDLPGRYNVPDIADCASLDQDDGSPLKVRLLKCLFGGVNADMDAIGEH